MSSYIGTNLTLRAPGGTRGNEAQLPADRDTIQTGRPGDGGGEQTGEKCQRGSDEGLKSPRNYMNKRVCVPFEKPFIYSSECQDFEKSPDGHREKDQSEHLNKQM